MTQMKIEKEQVVFKMMPSDADILASAPCSFATPVDILGDIEIGSDVIFYEQVKCKTLKLMFGSSARFLKDLHCTNIIVNAPLVVENELLVEGNVSGESIYMRCKSVVFRGYAISLELFYSLMDKSSLEKMGLETESSLNEVCQSEEQFLAVLGHCEYCNKEQQVQTIFGNDDQRISVCFDCISFYIIDAPSSELALEVKRIPTNWEIAHMSESEKTFFADFGYVNFQERRPEEPFLQVSPESMDGELCYKEIILYDPGEHFLKYEEAQEYRTRVIYNGGPKAWCLTGTFAAASVYTLGLLVPCIGAIAATAAFAASLPLSWKFSKKLTNIVNDKYIVPYELERRRNLIEGRRKDQRVRQEIYIETI